LKPITPQQAAGRRTDPPVSEPTDISTTPAATPAAEPLEDPPTIRSGHCGLTGVPPGIDPGDPEGQFMHRRLADNPPAPRSKQGVDHSGIGKRRPSLGKDRAALTGRQTGNVDAILDRSGQGAFAKFE
jgi:hypothetical protein